jgi:tRNA A-37 threonylcarbamoyl transferase component Bud32
MIVLHCPRCNQTIEVSDFLAGFTVVCTSCKLRVDVPRQSPSADDGAVGKDLEPIGDPIVTAGWSPVTPASGTNDDPAVAPPAGARFRILRLHAKGGLGLVSVALDEELHREVALKEIQECHADDQESRARFLVEAEITGRLEHPGVVPVYGLGHYADGRPFYAMRLIKGDSLKDAIDGFHKATAYGRDPGEQTLELRQLLGRFIDVCQTIQYAHDRGILHRDLKPSNIMLGKYGETLVVDWGSAKALGQKESASAEATLKPASGGDGSKTLPGSAIGTPAYMSPEQAAGRLDQLGPASDVYSLGATLYALLTGSPPFSDSVVAAILNKVQHGDFPRPRLMNSYTDPAMEAICLKAMSLKIADRYQSPRALADDLERWLADKPVSAWPEPWTVRTRRWVGRHKGQVVAASLIFLALIGGLIGIAYGVIEAGNQRVANSLREQAEHDRDAAEVARGEAVTARDGEKNARGAAEKAQKDAETARDDLAREREKLARVEYGRTMQMAHQEWRDNNHVAARTLLAGTRKDLRGWEWQYVDRLCHADLLTFQGRAGQFGIVPCGRVADRHWE